MPDDLSTNDRQLTKNDIGVLENAEQVVHFFAKLGYDVDVSIPIGHAALDMDTTDLRQQIRSIRRVGADPEDGDIVIYLFEVRSVTVALTQTIARRFRERPESALLVLTKDYETLDFVLVERELAAGKKLGGGLKQIIRPRTLTVKRRNPSPVDLRVLKRFTFTEADADFQWEKLRSAFTLAEWTEQYFNNRALFSDYYLLERLTDPNLTPAWAEDVRQIGRRVLGHLADARPRYSNQPEQVIREGLFEPLFTQLGFEYDVNKPGDSDLDEPDYVLYAKGKRDKPIALAMTYVWNRNLDDMDPKRDAQTSEEIPGALVVNVLAKAETKWVIVTNGKLWRLYSTTADNKATNYYEIDLEEAVTAPENDQETALKYWWLFFRRQAFEGFLDDLWRQSADYAKGLGERLKERTFTTIFPHFAEGFIRQMRAEGEADPDLDAVFAATMTFLYRLMFILYAESLNLLPVTEERGYGAFSLYRLKKELADAGGMVEEEAPERLGQHYRSDASKLYERLQLLFHAIDQGAQDLNLPMYNGGLFSDDTDEGRFLAKRAIPDRYLALGLDRLCRIVDDKTHALAAIDYKSLGVRQLGSIYEGLLEFKLRVAPEKLVVVKEKGKEVYLPAKKAGRKRVVATLDEGDIYLENDKRERKATGSYYTPDYIVKYIVEHTVGPVLARKFEALTPRLREAQKRYGQHKKTVEARGNDQPPELFWNQADMLQLADDCLDITVLDPAMGSGHFLVEAVDFISNRLIEFLNAWTENPVWGLLARTRQEILADMERQTVSIDAERLTRVALLKRSVLKRCIYGVDLNEMAVELAKVSLWLDAFTLGAPLSFLDHHLKWGNSLIGARVSEVQEALGREQLSLFAQSKFAGVMLATDLMRQVSFLSDNTAGQLQESRAAFRSARDHLAPYKRVLDVYTSRWFGNHPKLKKKDAFDPCVEFLQREDVEPWLNDPDNVALPAKDYMEVRTIGETALRVAAKKRFFHWELEFPEVFFAPATPGGQDVQLREDGGFDAVVGNPPYDELSENELGRTIVERDYLTNTNIYKPTQISAGRLNWYHYFMVLGLQLCIREGRSGQIVPMSWMGDTFTLGVRKWILENHAPVIIEAFPQKDDPNNRVFFDAKLPTSILVAEKGNSSGKFLVRVHPGKDILPNPHYLADLNVLESLAPDICLVPLVTDREWGVLEKLAINPHLGALSEIGAQPTSGEIIFNSSTRPFMTSDPSHELILRGSHIQRYELAEKAKQGKPEYLKKEEYLAKAQSRSKAFAFLEPRVVYQEGSAIDAWRRVVPTYLPARHICGHKICYFVDYKIDRHALLAIFASTLINWLVERLSVTNSLPAYLIGNLPFPRFKLGSDTTQHSEPQQIQKVYARCITEGNQYGVEFAISRMESGKNRMVHDLLAYLAEQMIELNKRKQAEVKRFLGWVEEKLAGRGDPPVAPTSPVAPTPPVTRTGGGIDSFTGKTILKNYLGDYQKGEKELPWADFEYRLHQNRNRYKANLSEVKGEIQAEYEKSLAVLLPIKRQLAHTDALIDQIVYKLYGLTDEEVAIIERPAYEQALSEAKAKVLKDKKLQKDPEAAAEKMAETILPAAQRLVTQVPLPRERRRLDKALPGWHLFPADIATFLLTAEYNLRNLPDHLDFSTSVIAYAKAVETMLYHRLFMRFRAEAGASDADCKNKFLQQFMRGERDLTLGSISIILQSSKEAALRAFIATLYPLAPTSFFGPAGVVARIKDPDILELRNQAAHDQTLAREDARAAREWALGILGNL